MDYPTAVKAALDGDEEGFLFLYKSTYTKMYHKAFSYMKNECDTEDVLQDSYMKAKRSLHKLSDPEKFPSWLGRIVINTSKSYLKKKKPLLFLDINEDSEETGIDFYEIQDDDTLYQPEKSYSDKEIRTILREMIDSLSDEQRMCILMYHFDERSIRDIAEEISCSENTVKSRLCYGRKALRKKMEAMQKDGYKFYGTAPIPILKYFMEKDSLSSDFLKTAKAAMENSEIIAATRNNNITNTAAVAVVKRTTGKRILASCITAAVVGAGAFAVLNIPRSNGFVDLADLWKEKDNSEYIDNIGEQYLNYIAGNPTADEFKTILEALPDNFVYEGLETSEYFSLTKYFCHKIKNESVIKSEVTQDGYYEVEDINKLFSVFSNYIISEDNYDGGEVIRQSADNLLIKYDYNNEFVTSNVDIINVERDNNTNIITVIFSRTFDVTSNSTYAIENETYTSGKKQATLEPDYKGYYRIKSIN